MSESTQNLITRHSSLVTSNLTAIYGRASTALQDNSIEAQDKQLRAYAELNGLLIDPAAIFLEEDVSGSVPVAQRPKGCQLLRLLAQGRHQNLLVAKVDRLGRGAVDVQTTIQKIHAMGVRVLILDMGGIQFDSRSSLSGMIMAILAWCAQMELERIRERINTALQLKASKGELIGTVPYGYDAIETGAVTPRGIKIRTLVPNETEIAWLRKMYQWRLEGMSYQHIARKLNTLGVPTKRAGEVLNHRRHKRAPLERRIARSGWQQGNVHRLLHSSHTASLIHATAVHGAAAA